MLQCTPYSIWPLNQAPISLLGEDKEGVRTGYTWSLYPHCWNGKEDMIGHEWACNEGVSRTFSSVGWVVPWSNEREDQWGSGVSRVYDMGWRGRRERDLWNLKGRGDRGQKGGKGKEEKEGKGEERET